MPKVEQCSCCARKATSYCIDCGEPVCNDHSFYYNNKESKCSDCGNVEDGDVEG